MTVSISTSSCSAGAEGAAAASNTIQKIAPRGWLAATPTVPHGFDQMLDDGQPEPDAAHGARPAGVDR